MNRVFLTALFFSTSTIALAEPQKLKVTSVPLPGATGPVSLDYIAVDRQAGQVWIPAGGTGSVDVYDIATGEMHRIEGFKTVEREGHGKKQMVGPSSVGLSDTTAYVGNRATSEVCAIDKKTLKLGNCAPLASPPDGVEYVASTKEVWVTTPKDSSITILDSDLKPAGKITLEGSPEGYAVDDVLGVFSTNLEDKDQTLTIDTHTHKILSGFGTGCGKEGPRGIAVEPAAKGSGKEQPKPRLTLIGCTDHAAAILLGKITSTLDTGAGVDNIDYLPSSRSLFVASGKTSKLHVLHADEKGKLTEMAVADTTEGARSVAVDSTGRAFLPDPMKGRLLIVEAPK